MKLSIFTCTHNPKYLPELEASIIAQTYENWQWVILLNNGAEFESRDERIKIFTATNEGTAVGALKKEACSLATGDVLVEVDHDDLITPDCLQKIAEAFENPEIGFVYSDNAKLGEFTPYHADYGWSHRTFEHEGKELFAMNSQPLTAGRMSYIWFAPDHVRAWRKSIYDEIGGHNENLPICDDQDLMLRTYLATRFYHIPEVLYIYRITGDNTWLQRNADIQTRTVQLYDQYVYEIATRFAEINNLLKIDLCGGHNKPEWFLSLDKYNGDIICDLDKGIPLPDNSVGVIRAHDAIEHLKDKQFTMSEIHRVLAKGGILLSSTPSTDGRGAFQDPTHVSFWNENSFWYWCREEQARYINNTDVRFRECRLYTHFPSAWHQQNNISYVVAHLEKI